MGPDTHEGIDREDRIYELEKECDQLRRAVQILIEADRVDETEYSLALDIAKQS